MIYLVCSERVNPLPDDKILDRSKLKQSADNSFKFDEKSRKFSKRVEKTVGKEEIARYEQFLLYLQCFQKACFAGVSKGVIVWEWVKHAVHAQIAQNGLHGFSSIREKTMCSVILIITTG